MSRRAALLRLNGLLPQVREHLDKIHAEPSSDAVNHWRSEVRNWLKQMDAVLRHLGDRTETEWRDVIGGLRTELGEGSDE